MRYRLGLPAWGFPGWKDRYFSAAPSRLASYAGVFNTVEGNTTFYAIPDDRSVKRWRAAVEDADFRFCFKLPRTVTHERTPSRADLAGFFKAMEPLGDRLGPFLVQFPATVGPHDTAWLASLLERLPAEYRYAVEVRHPGFFTEPGRLEPLLRRLSMGRVALDSRPLYQGDRSHPEVRDALHEKPDLPVLTEACSGIAFVRLVLHPESRYNARCLEEWVSHTARHLSAGHDVFMMIHCPNNLHCPGYAREFHDRLRARSDMAGLLPALAPFPVPQQRKLL